MERAITRLMEGTGSNWINYLLENRNARGIKKRIQEKMVNQQPQTS